MSGYIQRLLERGINGPASEAAAATIAEPHAHSAAPIRSPFAEADQRLQIADFDGALLTAFLLDDAAPQNDPWIPPDAPFGTPRDQQESQAPVTPAPTTAPERTLTPAPLFGKISPTETPTSSSQTFKDVEESLTRKRLKTDAPRHDAEPAFSASKNKATFTDERIVETSETERREPGEARYLFLRSSGLDSKCSKNPQPRDFDVVPLKQTEMFRDVASAAEPRVMTTGEAPAVNTERVQSHSPARHEARAEPALARQKPEPTMVAAPASATEEPPTAHRQKEQALKTQKVHRGANEVLSDNEPLAPWSSASAASVIGPLPTRPLSLTIRGCRRR